MSFLNTLFGTHQENSEKIKILDKATYAEAVQAGNIQLVDVRTASEYNMGHIKNAIHIDYYDPIGFQKAFEKLDTTKPVCLYCRSGSRSQQAGRKLVAMGFIQMYDLKGGFIQWD